jgi:hypothetical protein
MGKPVIIAITVTNYNETFKELLQWDPQRIITMESSKN